MVSGGPSLQPNRAVLAPAMTGLDRTVGHAVGVDDLDAGLALGAQVEVVGLAQQRAAGSVELALQPGVLQAKPRRDRLDPNGAPGRLRC